MNVNVQTVLGVSGLFINTKYVKFGFMENTMLKDRTIVAMHLK